MAKPPVEFEEWAYQFVDQDQSLQDWLRMRGMSILRAEGSFRCALSKASVPRTPGRVRDDLTDVLRERLPGAGFNLVHVERMEPRGNQDVYYLACYYAVSNNLLPQTAPASRENASDDAG